VARGGLEGLECVVMIVWYPQLFYSQTSQS